MTSHGATRSCTKCGCELWWNEDRSAWEGEHAPDCYVGKKPDAAMPTGVRGPREDESEAIGATGRQLWAVTMQMGTPGARFEEVLGVRAVTEEGALLLAQESRLNIAGLSAQAQ